MYGKLDGGIKYSHHTTWADAYAQLAKHRKYWNFMPCVLLNKATTYYVYAFSSSQKQTYNNYWNSASAYDLLLGKYAMEMEP